jgi:hypothetical protein
VYIPRFLFKYCVIENNNGDDDEKKETRKDMKRNERKNEESETKWNIIEGKH